MHWCFCDRLPFYNALMARATGTARRSGWQSLRSVAPGGDICFCNCVVLNWVCLVVVVIKIMIIMMIVMIKIDIVYIVKCRCVCMRVMYIVHACGEIWSLSQEGHLGLMWVTKMSTFCMWVTKNVLFHDFYSTPSTEGVESTRGNSVCLCVCLFVRNHFFILWILNNLMI